MKKKQLLKKVLTGALLAVMLFSSAALLAQVKVGNSPTTVNAGSALEIESTDKGLLMPRISLTNTTTWGLLGMQAAGMHVYNTNAGITYTNDLYPILIGGIGEYYWDGTGWVATGNKQAQRTQTWIKATGTGSQVVGFNATPTILDFTAKTEDRGAEFNLGANTATVKTTGIYLITVTVKKLPGAIAGKWGAVLQVRGSTSGTFTISNVDGTDNSDDQPTFSGSTTVFFNSGEVIDVEVFRGPLSPAFDVQNPSVSIIKLSN